MEFVEPLRTKAEIERMKKSFKNERDYFLFVLGINSALRISDLLKLKVKDLKGTHLTVRETKTKKTHKQIISEPLRVEIDRYIKGKADEDFLFPSREGGTLTRSQAHRILKEASEKANIKVNISTHTLRKTFAFHYYKMKNDLATTQKLLGHSTSSITLAYLGLTQDDLDSKLINFGL